MPINLKTYLPDAVTDTTARRARRAAQRAGIAARLQAAAGGERLAWLVVPVAHVVGADFYDQALRDLAADLAAEIVGSNPAWVTIQRGRNGGVHLNIVMPDHAVPDGLPDHTFRYAGGVWKMSGLVKYLSGPADQAASPYQHPVTGKWLRPTTAEQRRAADDYRHARGRLAKMKGPKGRLPRMSWTLNLPQLPRTPLFTPLRVSKSCPFCHPPRGRHRSQDKINFARDLTAQGLSRKQVAEAVGVAPRTVTRWATAGLLSPQPEAEAEQMQVAPPASPNPTPSVSERPEAEAGEVGVTAIQVEATTVSYWLWRRGAKPSPEKINRSEPDSNPKARPVRTPADLVLLGKKATERSPKPETEIPPEGVSGRPSHDSRGCQIPAFSYPPSEVSLFRPRPP